MREQKEMTLKGAVELLHLHCDTSRASTYIPCPFCDTGTRKQRMNLNFAKDRFRCNKCGDKALLTEGGPVSFWMLMNGINDPKEAARDYYRKAEGNSKVEVVRREKKEEYVEPKPAPIAVRDHTYSLLLSILTLRKRHLESLRDRGLNDRQIKENCYRSTPSDPKATAKKLLDRGATLEGVPGFYKDRNGEWTMVDCGSGILIPQRNSKGEIQGFQIRSDGRDHICRNCRYFVKGVCGCEKAGALGEAATRDATCPQFKEAGSRYFALSSRDRDCGTGSQTYVHFRQGVRGVGDVIITEGALKADVISALSGYSVLSVPGVNSLKFLPQALRSLLRKDLCRVIIAYDMDIRENDKVKRARDKLESLLRHLEIPYKNLSWDEAYKGLDDYLWAEKQKRGHN